MECTSFDSRAKQHGNQTCSSFRVSCFVGYLPTSTEFTVAGMWAEEEDEERWRLSSVRS